MGNWVYLFISLYCRHTVGSISSIVVQTLKMNAIILKLFLMLMCKIKPAELIFWSGFQSDSYHNIVTGYMAQSRSEACANMNVLPKK